MTEAAATLREAGFDHVFESQTLFRLLLQATARPGSVLPLGETALRVPPGPLRPACALLLSLLDLEVTLSVLGPEAVGITEYLVFNTGARPAPLTQADFVLVLGADSAGQIGAVKRGTLLAPHEGATVVYAPEALGMPGAPGTTLCLTGPGIPGQRRLTVSGMARAEWERLAGLSDFPLGVDLWLAARDGHLAAIPRSVRFTVEA